MHYWNFNRIYIYYNITIKVTIMHLCQMICIQLWHAMIAPSYEMLWLWHIAPRQVEEDLDLDDLFW